MIDPVLRAEGAGTTHEGKVRPCNEDSFVACPEDGIWAVADGMGGHERGEWASAVIVDGIGEGGLPQDFEHCCAVMADRIHAANRVIFGEARSRGQQMGSTVVALVVRDRRFAVLWAGDSRAYLLRNGELHRLSTDHSQVQEMVDRGLLSPEEAQDHPMGHVLARAVGVQANLELDVVQDEIEPGDTFLLCTDGLHGFLPASEIAALLGGNPAESVSGRLVEATLELGAPDNVTAIAIRFTEPTLLILPQLEGTA